MQLFYQFLLKKDKIIPLLHSVLVVCVKLFYHFTKQNDKILALMVARSHLIELARERTSRAIVGVCPRRRAKIARRDAIEALCEFRSVVPQ